MYVSVLRLPSFASENPIVCDVGSSSSVVPPPSFSDERSAGVVVGVPVTPAGFSSTTARSAISNGGRSGFAVRVTSAVSPSLTLAAAVLSLSSYVCVSSSSIVTSVSDAVRSVDVSETVT